MNKDRKETSKAKTKTKVFVGTLPPNVDEESSEEEIELLLPKKKKKITKPDKYLNSMVAMVL